MCYQSLMSKSILLIMYYSLIWRAGMLTNGKLFRLEDRFWLKTRACVSMLLMSCLDLMCTLSLNFLYLVPWSQANVSDSQSKWFLQSLGVEQFHKLLAGFENKAAQAVCTFAYCEGPGHEPIVFQGRTAVSHNRNANKTNLMLRVETGCDR
jgi:hypothetical protein